MEKVLPQGNFLRQTSDQEVTSNDASATDTGRLETAQIKRFVFDRPNENPTSAIYVWNTGAETKVVF